MARGEQRFVSNVRGPLFRAHSEPSDGELRMPVRDDGPADGEARDAAPRREKRPDLTSPCELPAPTDQGRVYRPPHPIFAIAFVYLVSLALLWGALSGAGEPIARLAVTFMGLCVCLAAAVHWIEGVELAHVPAKLGLSGAPARAWGVGIAAALPGLVWVARALVVNPAAPGEGATEPLPLWGSALRLITLAAAAAWQEGFYRGFVFRSLMRRHGFLTSAMASALLLCVATVVGVGSPLVQGRALQVAAVELPLSLALCALFWLHDQALGPAFVVRVAVLAATWWSGSVWPALGATAVLLGLARLRRAGASASNAA
jgi:hypothetical protein